MTTQAQIRRREKSFFVVTAATVPQKKTIARIAILTTVNKVDEGVIVGEKRCIILKSSALIERLFHPRSRASLDINPPRLFVNSNKFDRSDFSKKNEEKNISVKYAATLKEANHFLSFRRNTPKKRGYSLRHPAIARHT